MRYIWQHIQNIIEQYEGTMPLSHFLKGYFKDRPKLGSRDRKLLSEMAYNWYRCGKGLNNLELGTSKKDGITLEEKIKACLFLCGSQQKIVEEFLGDEWDFDAEMPIPDRLEILRSKGISFDAEKLFSYTVGMSDGITRQDWLLSMLQKPRLFIRVRKNKDKITALLHDNAIPFEAINENCLALPIGAAIDQLLPQDAYAVQDASSQQTGTYFKPQPNELWYDCCSGAGGKSLLLMDMEPTVKLTVSDTRESILQNLKKRFLQYQLALPSVNNIDVANSDQLKARLKDKQFDNIICDAPCSGSGTWARTPEQLYFFHPRSLQQFSKLQKAISENAAAYLKPDGRFFYITCSVFQEENDWVVEHLIAKTGMTLESKQIINGIPLRADSMFIAVLKK